MKPIPYTDAELVKLNLLDYPNPQGLHPVEAEWRNVARKLKKERDRNKLLVQDLRKLLDDTISEQAV